MHEQPKKNGRRFEVNHAQPESTGNATLIHFVLRGSTAKWSVWVRVA